MEKIIEFVQWFSAQKTRAIALVLGVSIFIGMGLIIFYQHSQAKKNDEIARRIDRQHSLDISNFTRRCDSINRSRELEIQAIHKQYNETLEKVYNDYRDLYMRSESLKSKY